MKRLLVILICLLGARGGWGAAGSGTSAEKQPLDLPVGGPKASSKDENAPETIRFFGGTYEGDGFFFLLDVSGSMYGEKLMLLKMELRDSVQSLSPRSEFGLVAFSDYLRVFLPNASRATSSKKLAAIHWVQDLGASGGTYMLLGAQRLLRMANRSHMRSRVVIAVGDGLPSQPDAIATLNGILAANTEKLPWNTIFIGSNPSAVAFMSDLSKLTGGTHRTHVLD